MKKFFVIMSLALTTSTLANTISVYNFDDVDAVTANGKTISAEDLRDGFATIKGVRVNDDQVSVTGQSKVKILLRNSTTNKLFRSSTMAVKTGGDMGGG